MKLIRCFCLVAAFCALLCGWSKSVNAGEVNVNELLNQAGVAFAKSQREHAIELATQAITSEPRNAQAYYVRGRFFAETKQPLKALADLDQALILNPGAAIAYYTRAVERFKLGRIKESAADFDKFVELEPDQAPKLWQRGIVCYYAGRYEDAQKQFESHQTINSNDVENAVWHFLCVARRDGIDQARAGLMKIQNDSRVPMMQIYALFAGKGSAEEVMNPATGGEPAPGKLNNRLFYSHFYIGLYFEVAGNEKLAREHILQATELFKVDHFMGDVARVHTMLMARQQH